MMKIVKLGPMRLNSSKVRELVELSTVYKLKTHGLRTRAYVEAVCGYVLCRVHTSQGYGIC